jgi:N-ethylmaleimide reductase
MVFEIMQDSGPSADRFHTPATGDIRDHQRLLLREADHRIKNSLSIVASMLMLQRGRISDVEAAAALDDSVARIMAVADVHRALQVSARPGTVSIASTLRELCSQLGRIRSELDLHCTADGEILMEAKHAIPLSLVVSELLLNAMKHAYLPGEPGTITVGGRLVDGVLLITVADHGAGMPTTTSSTGNLGQTMVRSFCRQLGAVLDFSTVPKRGTVVSVSLPLPPDGTPKAASDSRARSGQGAQTGRSAQPRSKDATMQQNAARGETREISLFDPVRLGPLFLANRIVMAPLTRSRASRDGVPSPFAADYYAQRASAGLIIAEATNISPQARGYAWTPGIYSDAQVEVWSKITAAVHGHCGRIYDQLWHVGRASHPDLQPGGALPVAPSAIPAQGQTYTEDGFRPFVVPRALETDEIPGIVEQYRHAARYARQAGFDGVEIHAANGYLLDQFIRDSTNKRTDRYGGTRENRVRLVLEVAEAVTEVWGGERVGIRLSPVSPNVGEIPLDSDVMGTYGYLIEQLNRFGLVYLHCVEGETTGPRNIPSDVSFPELRRRFKGLYIANNGYDLELATHALREGLADLIAFGRPFIANPDLVARLRNGWPLAKAPKEAWYGGGAEGYIDSPTYQKPTEDAAGNHRQGV